MSVKRHPLKKSTGQKKIVKPLDANIKNVGPEKVRADQEAVIAQFYRIQRGYSIFVNELVKEFSLVKKMIKKEAILARHELKERINLKRS